MDRTRFVFFVLMLFLLQVSVVHALTAGEAEAAWAGAKGVSKEKQAAYADAKIAYAANKSAGNNRAVVDTGKAVLNAALDEAKAWLEWKGVEANSNPDLPDNLKQAVSTDVKANLAKIDGLRTDVAGVSTQFELGLVWLKMLGKYGELLTDVARDTGKIWVFTANKYADTAEGYQVKLRTAAETVSNNTAIIGKLDAAESDITEARSNINKAQSSYEEVVVGGTPFIKFAEGNDYLRVARTNLLSAQSNLYAAYGLMPKSG